MKAEDVFANVELITKNKKIKKKALVDTGAARSFISKNLADEFGTFEPFRKEVKFGSANKGGIVKVVGRAVLDVYFEGTEIPGGAIFFVADNLREDIDIIIGRPEIDAWDIIFTDKGPKLKNIPPKWDII